MARSHFRDRLRSPRPKCKVCSPTTPTLCSAPVDSLFFIPLSQPQSFVLDCFGCFAFRTLLKDPHTTSHLRCWLMPRDSPVLRESFRASPHRVPSVPCPCCVPSTLGTACCCFALILEQRAGLGIAAPCVSGQQSDKSRSCRKVRGLLGY